MLTYVKTNNHLVIFLNGDSYTVTPLHINYRKITAAFENQDEEALLPLFDTEALLANGFYDLHKRDDSLAVTHFNSSGIGESRLIKTISDFTQAQICSLGATWEHIGTFISKDEIISTYPEYFL